MDLASLPFVQAKWFTLAQDRQISLICIHVMEAPQKPHTARNVARYFADGCEGRPASAHYCVDSDEVIHTVQNKDVAYGAPGANRNGLHIEHAGYTAQSAADWSDSYSEKMLHLSAQVSAELVKRYGVPVRWLSPQEVAAGEKGFTSHANVTVGLHDKYPMASHMDPGNGFPVAHYLALVKSYL